MTDADIGKIKGNVATMVQKGAPEADIDRYISESGTTLDAVKNFQSQPQGFWSHEKKNSLVGNAITGAQESGVSMMQFGNFVGRKLYGELPSDKSERAAYNSAQQGLEKQEGPGVANFIARQAGDPLNYPFAGTGGKAAIRGAEAVSDVAKATKADLGLIKKGWSARDDATLDAASDSLFAQADKDASAMRKAGVSLKPEISTALMKHIDEEIKASDRFTELHPGLHGETMKVLDEMRAQAPKGMTVPQFDNYRKLLRKAAKAGGEDAELSRHVMDTMRDAAETMVKKSPPGQGGEAFKSLYNYVDKWSKAQRFDTLSSIVKDAKGDPNKIQIGFKQLLKNDKKMRGFNTEEREAIKRASENSTLQSLTTLASKFGVNINKGVSGNTLPFAGALTAKLMGAPRTLEAGVIAGGTAAGYGRKLMTRGTAEKALQAVEARKTGLNAGQALGTEIDPLAPKAIQ